jgi:hypothetical protein
MAIPASVPLLGKPDSQSRKRAPTTIRMAPTTPRIIVVGLLVETAGAAGAV